MPEEQTISSPPQQPPLDERELGFDQVLERLHKIVTRIEQGSLPLEQALQLFEDGVRLSRRGSSILDATEQRIELLVRGEDGNDERKPLKAPPGSPQASPADSP